MKSILALLFLICASQAVIIDDISEYNYGFYSALGFNYEQHTQIQSCVQDIYTLYDDAIELLNATRNSDEETFIDVIQFVEALTGNLSSNCEAYKNLLISYIQENAVIPQGSTLRETVTENAKLYYAEVVQSVAEWIRDVVSGQDYFAGETQALLLKTLIGAYTPNYTVPELNMTKYVPFNSSQFYAEFYQSLSNKLGITNQSDIETFTQCGNTIQSLIFTVIQAKSELSKPSDVESRLGLYLEVAESVYNSAQACRETLKLDLELAAPLFQTFKKSPVLTSLHIVFNIASNLPELIQDQKEYIVAIEQGEYTFAGEIAAEQQMLALEGIFNFNLTQQA